MVCWKTLAFLLLCERVEKQQHSKVLNFVHTSYIIMQFSNRCWKVGHYTRLTDWLLESLVWKLFHLYFVYLRRFFSYIFAILIWWFFKFAQLASFPHFSIILPDIKDNFTRLQGFFLIRHFSLLLLWAYEQIIDLLETTQSCASLGIPSITSSTKRLVPK